MLFRSVAAKMLQDAKALESAGADLVLLECVPNEVGRSISRTVAAPVIGIGAGPDVDGQILVLYDILGITLGPTPRFVKNFMAGVDSPLEAVKRYIKEVKDHTYPAKEHCFS